MLCKHCMLCDTSALLFWLGPLKKKASRFRSLRLVIPITSKTQTQGMEETYNRKPSLLRSVLLPLTPEKRASRFRSLRSYSVSPPKHKPKVIEETDYREPSLLRSVHQRRNRGKRFPLLEKKGMIDGRPRRSLQTPVAPHGPRAHCRSGIKNAHSELGRPQKEMLCCSESCLAATVVETAA